MNRGVRNLNSSLGSFLDYFGRILIVAQGNEFGVTQLIAAGPLGEINSYDSFRPQPNAAFHFFRGKPLSPSAFRFLR